MTKEHRHILAGDIGGTKTVVSLLENRSDGLKEIRESVFASQEHGALDEILEKFLREEKTPVIQAACFGIAGAVIDGKSDPTNLPWHLDEKDIAKTLGVPGTRLINDLEAAAYGMLHLGDDELHELNRGRDPGRLGNAAVLAAGTGLGEAMLYWDGKRHHVIASEGGHADFAPRNDEEIELLKYLREKHGGHVSYERVLSGPGFFNVYCFLRDSGFAAEPEWMTERLEVGDPSAVVAEAGLKDKEPLSVRTLELFSNIYGAEASNLALKCVAVGGVFIGGGIAPKILPALKAGHFMDGYRDKGRFTELVEGMRVSVALNPRTPLIGAAYYALDL